MFRCLYCNTDRRTDHATICPSAYPIGSQCSASGVGPDWL